MGRAPKQHYQPQAQNVAQEKYSCLGCQSRDEHAEFLKSQIRELQSQNERLQEKLISLVPEAMNSYHGLQMTRAAQGRPQAMNGIVRQSDTIPDETGEFVDNLFDSILMPAQRRVS